MKKTNMRRKLTIAFSSLWVLVASGQSMKEYFDFDWQFVYAVSKGGTNIESALKTASTVIRNS